MMNLFWGYRLWNNGANNMLAYCYHTNSTACLCHGADHMLAFCRSISPPQKRRSISKMQICYHMLRTCEPSYTGRIYSRLLWMLSTWYTLQFPFAVPRRIVEGLRTGRRCCQYSLFQVHVDKSSLRSFDAAVEILNGSGITRGCL